MAVTRRTFVITLVHGTWATNAEWTQKDSRLHRKLCEKLDGDVLIKGFQWSGKNSYSARQQAGEKLQQFLTKITHDYPTAQHLVMAHSHGGNVALYGLNDPLLAKRISGLVTLATPFLICTPKNFWVHIALLFSGAFFGLGFALLTNVVLPLVYRGLEYSHTLDRWLEITVYVGVLWLAYGVSSALIEAITGLISWLIELYEDLALPRQSELMSGLVPQHCANIPLLALRFGGDEARLWLAFLAMITMPFSLVFRLVGYVFFAVYAFALLMIAADLIVALAIALFDVWIPLWPWMLARELYWFSFSVLCVAFVGVLSLPRLLRGHGLGFGKESILTPLLVRIVPADLPEGFTNTNVVRCSLLPALREMIAGRGLLSILNLSLLHSWLYQHDPAIQDICRWINRLAHRETD